VDMNGWTALHFAAFHGRLGCVQLLLRRGGRAGDVENSGCTAGEKIYKSIVVCKQRHGQNIYSLCGYSPESWRA